MQKAKKNNSKDQSKRTRPKKKLTSVNTDLNQEQIEKESRFGGIPDRDLKKNLGCG